MTAVFAFKGKPLNYNKPRLLSRVTGFTFTGNLGS